MKKNIQSINYKIKKFASSIEKLKSDELNTEEVEFIKKYQPQKFLIIYGTLGPGRPNHSKIEHINGIWKKGIIRGKLINEGWGAAMGYFAFKNTPENEQEIIQAYILISDELHKHWEFLDEFEGDEYTRTLTQYQLEDGTIGVGNIYAFKEKHNV